MADIYSFDSPHLPEIFRLMEPWTGKRLCAGLFGRDSFLAKAAMLPEKSVSFWLGGGEGEDR